MPSLEKSMEKRSSLLSALQKDAWAQSPSSTSKSKSSSLCSPRSQQKSKRSSSPSKKRSSSPRRSSRSDASRSSTSSGGKLRQGSPPRIRRSSTNSQSSASRSSDKGGNRMVRSKRHTASSSETGRSLVGRHNISATTPKPKTQNRPQVSAFLRNTHKELKEEITKIQKQIKFLQSLATMSEEKKIDMLFKTIDQDRGGTVDAEELAQAMRQNDELSFRDSLNKAIDMVATFDENGDGELDLREFRNYATKAAEQLELSCNDFCDCIIVQLLLSGDQSDDEEEEKIERERITEEVKKRGELFGVLNDQSLVALFDMFEKNDLGEAQFQTVAGLLYQCALEFAKNAGTEETLELLLMVDKKDDRMMDYNNFCRLLMTISKATHTPLEDIAENLVEAVERQETASTKTPDSPYIMLDDVKSTTGGNVNEEIDGLTYGRLKKLFHIWDKDGDGDISASELAEGLRKFQEASGINGDPEAMAQALISFDIDGDNQLDPHEFSRAMIQYAKAFGVELHLLIDMMCLTAKSKDNEDFGDFNKSFAFSTCDFDGQDNGFIDNDDLDFWQ